MYSLFGVGIERRRITFYRVSPETKQLEQVARDNRTMGVICFTDGRDFTNNRGDCVALIWYDAIRMLLVCRAYRQGFLTIHKPVTVSLTPFWRIDFGMEPAVDKHSIDMALAGYSLKFLLDYVQLFSAQHYPSLEGNDKELCFSGTHP